MKTSAEHLERAIETITGYRSETEGTHFFRYKFKRPSLPEVFSKEDHVGFATWTHGAMVVTTREIRRGLWVKTTRLPKPKRMHGRLVRYRANVGTGEQTLHNVDEIFFFAKLPPKVAC